VLLRILNERKYGDDKIPLITAIATGNPDGDEYYTEPLDPVGAACSSFLVFCWRFFFDFGVATEQKRPISLTECTVHTS
jgi:hypothetical protein